MAKEPANLESMFVDAWPPDAWRDVHVVLAVSGGADSVAMLRGAIAVKQRAGGAGRLFVAHLNHGIRPVEAAEHAVWLGELCRRLGVPLKIGSADVPALAASQGDGIEAAARHARYEFFRTTAEKLGARFVAMAHTADDQTETVLQRVIRGTGLAGLAGMPRTRPLSHTATLVRPLLGIRRQDVLRYLESIGQDFCTDPTNADLRLTRNRLRHDLLPRLRADFNDDVDAALLRLAQQADETQRLVAQLAEKLFRRTVKFANNQIQFDGHQLAAEQPLLVREVCKLAWNTAGWPLQDMGFDQWQQLHLLITSDATAGVLNLPASVRAERIGYLTTATQNPQSS